MWDNHSGRAGLDREGRIRPSDVPLVHRPDVMRSHRDWNARVELEIRIFIEREDVIGDGSRARERRVEETDAGKRSGAVLGV